MVKEDEKKTLSTAKPRTTDDAGNELPREGGLPVAMCPETKRVRPLGRGGVCFEAYWITAKAKDPSLTPEEAHEEWKAI